MSARRDKLLSLFYPRRASPPSSIACWNCTLIVIVRTVRSFVRSFVRTYLTRSCRICSFPGNLFILREKRTLASRIRVAFVRIAMVISLSRPFETSESSLDINQGDLLRGGVIQRTAFVAAEWFFFSCLSLPILYTGTTFRDRVSFLSSRRAGNDAFQTSSLFLFLFFLSFPSRFFHDQRGIDRLFFPFCPFYPSFFFYTFLDRICAARLPAAGRDDRSREFGNMAEARIRRKWREPVA